MNELMKFDKKKFNTTIRFFLRRNVEIAISRLPLDLTKAEADKILQLIGCCVKNEDCQNDNNILTSSNKEE